MSLKRYYQGKRLLLTGTTGFLGKVLLEKFLYSLPEVDLIYVLIRGKKGSNLNQRFKKQIVSSPCFDRIRDRYKNQFEDFIQNKVKPIQGDLHVDGLGLSKYDYEEIVERCHIIINCAASIDFNARLDQAIESNIRGSLRMMDLAKKVKNIEIFTHISTCYVNCNLTGLLREQIYEGNYEPEQMFSQLSKMSVRELVANTPSILGKYPNTYTYTKALCERLMKLRRGDLTMSIVRPAIINTSYLQPFPGWLDSIAAAAAYYMFAGLGIVKEVEGDPEGVGDTVPVDIVVANIIVATAFNAFNKKLSVYHVGSSDRNPVSWATVRNLVNDFWSTNVSQSRVSKPNVVLTRSKLKLKYHQYKRLIPNYLYSKASPFLGSQHMKNANRLLKAEERAREIKKIFAFFVNGNWIYECRKVKELSNWLSESQRQSYLLDAADIDIEYFLILNNYGIQKYILKENIELPTPENFNLLRIRSDETYFSDIKWALSSGDNMIDKKKNNEIKVKLIGSSKVQNAIQEEVLTRLESSHKTFEEQKKIVSKEASDIINEITGEFRMPVVRFMAWTLHKIFRRIYEKVNINSEMFDVLKEIQKEKRIPIVLLPTHRSYIDFLIVSYIFFLYKLKLPYIISDEALMNAYLIPFLIKSSGAFFFRQAKFTKSKLYQAIFNEYVQKLLINGNNLEFFLEGARSRTGKTLAPRSEILDILIETVQNGMVNDVCMVPLTINYEKVLEGDTFPGQLLGEQKIEESLLRVIKAIPLLKINFGRVYVEIAEPIFVSNYIKKYREQELAAKQQGLGLDPISKKLAYDIIYCLNEKLVIMSTGVVSAVLLMYRKGISEDNLIKTVSWISKYIVRKGYKIGGINENSAAFAVRNAIQYLQTITIRTKKSIFELQIVANNQFEKILMLSYYRNTIAHAFLPEAFLGSAIVSFGEQMSMREGVEYDRLKEETIFLMDILSLEYLHPYNFLKNDRYDEMVQELVRNSIIAKAQNSKLKINKQQDKVLMLYCGLMRPALECYWSVILYLLTIANTEHHMIEIPTLAQFYDQIQWFIESFYEQKAIDCYEACSLQTIKNSLQRYQKMGLVEIKYISKKETRVTILGSVEKLNQLESHIKKFLQNIYLSKVSSPAELVRSSNLGVEYLPKL